MFMVSKMLMVCFEEAIVISIINLKVVWINVNPLDHWYNVNSTIASLMQYSNTSRLMMCGWCRIFNVCNMTWTMEHSWLMNSNIVNIGSIIGHILVSLILMWDLWHWFGVAGFLTSEQWSRVIDVGFFIWEQ